MQFGFQVDESSADERDVRGHEEHGDCQEDAEAARPAGGIRVEKVRRGILIQLLRSLSMQKDKWQDDKSWCGGVRTSGMIGSPTIPREKVTYRISSRLRVSFSADYGRMSRTT